MVNFQHIKKQWGSISLPALVILLLTSQLVQGQTTDESDTANSGTELVSALTQATSSTFEYLDSNPSELDNALQIFAGISAPALQNLIAIYSEEPSQDASTIATQIGTDVGNALAQIPPASDYSGLDVDSIQAQITVTLTSVFEGLASDSILEVLQIDVINAIITAVANGVSELSGEDYSFQATVETLDQLPATAAQLIATATTATAAAAEGTPAAPATDTTDTTEVEQDTTDATEVEQVDVAAVPATTQEAPEPQPVQTTPSAVDISALADLESGDALAVIQYIEEMLQEEEESTVVEFITFAVNDSSLNSQLVGVMESLFEDPRVNVAQLTDVLGFVYQENPGFAVLLGEAILSAQSTKNMDGLVEILSIVLIRPSLAQDAFLAALDYAIGQQNCNGVLDVLLNTKQSIEAQGQTDLLDTASNNNSAAFRCLDEVESGQVLSQIMDAIADSNIDGAYNLLVGLKSSEQVSVSETAFLTALEEGLSSQLVQLLAQFLRSDSIQSTIKANSVSEFLSLGGEDAMEIVVDSMVEDETDSVQLDNAIAYALTDSTPTVANSFVAVIAGSIVVSDCRLANIIANILNDAVPEQGSEIADLLKAGDAEICLPIDFRDVVEPVVAPSPEEPAIISEPEEVVAEPITGETETTETVVSEPEPEPVTIVPTTTDAEVLPSVIEADESLTVGEEEVVPAPEPETESETVIAPEPIPTLVLPGAIETEPLAPLTVPTPTTTTESTSDEAEEVATLAYFNTLLPQQTPSSPQEDEIVGATDIPLAPTLPLQGEGEAPAVEDVDPTKFPAIMPTNLVPLTATEDEDDVTDPTTPVVMEDESVTDPTIPVGVTDPTIPVGVTDDEEEEDVTDPTIPVGVTDDDEEDVTDPTVPVVAEPSPEPLMEAVPLVAVEDEEDVTDPIIPQMPPRGTVVAPVASLASSQVDVDDEAEAEADAVLPPTGITSAVSTTDDEEEEQQEEDIPSPTRSVINAQDPTAPIGAAIPTVTTQETEEQEGTIPAPEIETTQPSLLNMPQLLSQAARETTTDIPTKSESIIETVPFVEPSVEITTDNVTVDEETISTAGPLTLISEETDDVQSVPSVEIVPVEVPTQQTGASQQQATDSILEDILQSTMRLPSVVQSSTTTTTTDEEEQEQVDEEDEEGVEVSPSPSPRRRNNRRGQQSPAAVDVTEISTTEIPEAEIPTEDTSVSISAVAPSVPLLPESAVPVRTPATTGASVSIGDDEECFDVAPPGDLTCEDQKRFGKCARDWMKMGNYCRKTCGYCPLDCTDIQPTDEYTCEEQKGFGKCDEDWMINGDYCSATCDRCGEIKVTSDENSQRKSMMVLTDNDIIDIINDNDNCTDIIPQGDYTCEQQRYFGKCEMAWMIEGGYCEETCGRCDE